MKAEDLITWRKAKAKEHGGLTQKGLAKALGVSYQAVTHWEQGLRGIPALLPLALEALDARLRAQSQREGQMKRYQVRMTVYAAVEAGTKQEAVDRATESLCGHPLIFEVWATGTKVLSEELPEGAIPVGGK